MLTPVASPIRGLALAFLAVTATTGLGGCGRPAVAQGCERSLPPAVTTAKGLTAGERVEAEGDRNFRVNMVAEGEERLKAGTSLDRTIVGEAAAEAMEWKADPYGKYAIQLTTQHGHNFCLRAHAYAAQGVRDTLESVAKAVIAQCGGNDDEDRSPALSYVLQYRACAAGPNRQNPRS